MAISVTLNVTLRCISSFRSTDMLLLLVAIRGLNIVPLSFSHFQLLWFLATSIKAITAYVLSLLPFNSSLICMRIVYMHTCCFECRTATFPADPKSYAAKMHKVLPLLLFIPCSHSALCLHPSHHLKCLPRWPLELVELLSSLGDWKSSAY